MLMSISVDIVLPLDDMGKDAAIRQALAVAMGRDVVTDEIVDYRLVKESIDSRQRVIKFQQRYEVSVDSKFSTEPRCVREYPILAASARRVIIVGMGPAGIFAALRCIELGMKPIVLERGKDVAARRHDLAPITRHGTVIEDSNYCFGEGGAGTFSDGKLYTRATKRGPVREIYETFVAHGAPERILIDAHPHIGSNLLPQVVSAMRHSILNAGGEVHFQSKVTDLLLNADNKRVMGVICADGAEYCGDAVILSTGHSARDIYKLLNAKGILLEQKAFAVGVRIEHPQGFVDERQYHLKNGVMRPTQLPAARYAVATKIEGRGVHSFCMCPGGFIVPAATENDEVVVNGMSLSRRDSPFANSGLIVTVEPEDTRHFEHEFGVLAGIAYQRDIEVRTSLAGGGMQRAPAQLASDFLRGRVSGSLNKTSYFPGVSPCPLGELLPHDVVWRMQEGLREFEYKWRGYAGVEAQLIGCETRTSSPVRIPRDPSTLQHVQIGGLYPCGEGAGYAGGIASAAMDGWRCAEAIASCSRAVHD